MLDAYPRPPVFKTIDKRNSDSRRRSGEHMFGQQDDVRPEDPAFILRRAVAYRQTSRSRLSASLDDVALQHLHKERRAAEAAAAEPDGAAPTVTVEDHSHNRSLSRQELIAAQREASRANQRAMLSTNTNTERGVDVTLPNRAVLRSQRLDTGSSDTPEMRYSYVDTDGETYDVSDIVREEWQDQAQGDLLRGAVNQHGHSDGMITRVVEKIKDSKLVTPAQTPFNQLASGDRLSPAPPGSATSAAFSVSESSTYSIDRADTLVQSARTATPNSIDRGTPRMNGSPQPSPRLNGSPQPSPQPTRLSPSFAAQASSNSGHGHGPSGASDDHGSSFDTSTPSTPATTATHTNSRRSPIVLREADFGVSKMIAIVELCAAMASPSRPATRTAMRRTVVSGDDLDELLFGASVGGRAETHLEEMHPKLRDVYRDTFLKLDEMDVQLDALLQQATGVRV